MPGDLDASDADGRHEARGAKVPERITLEELRQLREAGEPVILADVRTDRSYGTDNLKAAGAIRLPPDDAVRRRPRSWDSIITRRWCCTVLERTKPQAPGWRESFERPAGRRPARWWVAGPSGRMGLPVERERASYQLLALSY